MKFAMSMGDFEATEIEYTMSTGDFEAFEATRQAINEVVWALKDDQVTTIGVYGKGGVGKTRMVKHVGAFAQKNGLFDHVIMATVSQSPDMTKIQGTLADLLGLKLKDDTEFGRARTLRKKIMKGNKMLIVLDDIWKTIDFLSIGIPSYMELQRCNSKVLLTTRIKNVCHTMKIQRKITLNILSMEDSWTLFVKNAVVSFDESEMLCDVAMNVVGECAGLPIALIAVAKALGEKDDLAEWQEAARRLKSSKPANLDDQEEVFNCIRLSYDYLKTEDAKSCFLLCCLFPEDYDIQIEDLLKYGIGNGVFEDSNTMQEARGTIISVVKHLKASSLLLDSEQPGCVRMHDVVRDVAISFLLFKDGSPQFLVKAGCELMDWPRINANKGYSAISLMRNKIHKLPKELVCSKLQILLLQSNVHMNEIPELFFRSLDALRVLDLSQTSISLLPPTFSLLTSLHTLYLDSCLSMITNISILGELKRLEILSMRELPLVKLPIEIGHLTNLRMLDFTGDCVDVVPSDVIRNLDKLEELYMQCNFADWGSISIGNEIKGSKVEGSSVTGSIVQESKDEGAGEENNAFFDELTGLSHLNILKVFISDAGCLPRNVRSNPNWVNFDICISGDSSIRELSLVSGSSLDYSRTLTLDITISTLPNWFVNVVTRNAEKLQYIKCQGLDNILVEHDYGRLHALKYFSVIGSSVNLEELMNTITWVQNEPVFKNLEELHLVQVGCLKELCVGELPPGSLCNLKLLKVNSCHKLVNELLPSNMLKRLQNLEILICEEIDQLEYVFGFEGLELEKIILTKLVEMRLENLGKLIKIWNGPAPYAICQNLKILVVSRCFELESLFTSDVARCLFQLEDLSVELCPMLDRVIEPSEQTLENKIVFLALKSLSLIKLPQLTRFYGSSGSATIGIDVECPSLKRLHVHRCPQFSTSTFGFHSRNQVQVNADKPLELVGTTQKSAERTVFPSTINQAQQRSISPTREPKSPVVLSIECLKGCSKAYEWTDHMLHTGDIVEELRIGTSVTIKSPYKNGRRGVQKILHASFKAKDTSIQVLVRRGRKDFTKLQACIVPNDSAGKKVYMLRSISDPNYTFEFCDRTEANCFELQASRNSRMVSAITRTKLQDGYVSYPWERRMQEFLPIPYSSSFYSVLFLPKASDRSASRYNDLDDTLARANVWFNASEVSGVPIVFMNIQTETLLTKISGETASSTVNAGSLSDLANFANESLYGFEDYHGVDIGIVRAVRLWYTPLGPEIPVEFKLQGDIKLGFAISRTEEGFIYVSSVAGDDENAPSSRSGLSTLYKEAMNASRLVVVSRVSDQKVLPCMVSSTGAVRCYDTASLSQKLSLHRHSKIPVSIHVFLWDRTMVSSSARPTRRTRQPNENQIQPLPSELFYESGGFMSERFSKIKVEKDTAGESSSRFHDFALSSNWV